jgi:hypothetical protein
LKRIEILALTNECRRLALTDSRELGRLAIAPPERYSICRLGNVPYLIAEVGAKSMLFSHNVFQDSIIAQIRISKRKSLSEVVCSVRNIAPNQSAIIHPDEDRAIYPPCDTATGLHG